MDTFVNDIRAALAASVDPNTTLESIQTHYRRIALVEAVNLGKLDVVAKLSFADDYGFLLEKTDIVNKLKNVDIRKLKRFIERLLNTAVNIGDIPKLKELLSILPDEFRETMGEAIDTAMRLGNVHALDTILNSSIAKKIDYGLSFADFENAIDNPNDDIIKYILSKADTDTDLYELGSLMIRYDELKYFELLYPKLNHAVKLRLIEFASERQYDPKVYPIYEIFYKDTTLSSQEKDLIFILTPGLNQIIAPIFYPTENKYPFLQKYHKSLDKTLEYIQSYRTASPNATPEQLLNELEEFIANEVQSSYRPQGKEAKEVTLNLYRKSGLIEKLSTPPIYLIPNALSQQTIDDLLNGQDSSYLKVINYIKSKGAYNAQITKKVIIDKNSEVIDQESKIWLGLKGTYIFDFVIEGKKLKFYITERSILIVPNYQSLDIEELTEGVVAALS